MDAGAAMTQAVRRLHPRPRQIDYDQAPVGALLEDLWKNSERLIRKELELATAEMEQSLGRVKKEAVSGAAGGAVLYGGVLTLLAAGVLLLSRWIEPWVAALIVGVVAAGAGAGLMAKARSQLRPERLTPRRTVRTIEDDVTTVKEAIE
jgi:hypothetical protein